MRGPLEGRFLEVKITPPEEYPKERPVLKFKSKINADFVDSSGNVDATKIAALSGWTHSGKMAAVLGELRALCEGLKVS